MPHERLRQTPTTFKLPELATSLLLVSLALLAMGFLVRFFRIGTRLKTWAAGKQHVSQMFNQNPEIANAARRDFEWYLKAKGLDVTGGVIREAELSAARFPLVTVREFAEVTKIHADAIRVLAPAIDNLLMQRSALPDAAIPGLAEDNWSVGYVGGFTDAFLYGNGIEPGGEMGRAAMRIAFESVFGSDNWVPAFNRYAELHKVRDPDVMGGIEEGGADVFKWLPNSSNIPLEWVEYLRHYGD